MEDKPLDKKSKIRLFTVKPSSPAKMKPAPEVIMRDLDDNLSVADIKGAAREWCALACELEML